MPILDISAFAWFLLCWVGYTRYADLRARNHLTLMSVMHLYRLQWMREMLHREVRIVDSSVVTILARSATFLASTTIFILAGLLAVLGTMDKAMEVVADLRYAVQSSREVWELKLFGLLLVFIYAFFKFTWSLRQFNYACILIGGFPAPDAVRAEDEARARRTARLLSLAGDNFNSGLRAYYFGLGTLSWFMHPALYMLVCGWVVLVLYRREFRSKTLEILCGPQADGRTDRA